MIRTTSLCPHFLSNSLSPETPLLSNAQLGLDSTFFTFSEQSTDPLSIASMTLAGMVGKLARMGILSMGAQQAAPLLQNFISHLGSIGAEAATFTLLQNGSFASHFTNFSTFRLVGNIGSASSAPAQHFFQSFAMVAGHQMAAALGFEEHSHESIAQQFFNASMITFQIQAGNLLGAKLSGQRLQMLERNLESRTREFTSTSSLPSSIFRLPSTVTMASEDGKAPPSPRRARKGATPMMERLSGPPSPIDPTSTPNLRPQPNKVHINNFNAALEAYMTILREGFVNLGVNRNTATAIDMCNMYENLYKMIPHNGRPFVWKGFLNNYLRSFSDFIQQAEGKFERDPDLDSLKDKVINIHDTLMLLQEALNIFQRQQNDLNEDERGLIALAQQAHEGFRLDRQARATRLTAATHGTSFQVNPEHQKHWTDIFIANKRDPYLAHNINIIMGNITLVAAEHVGGSFYRALGRSALANRVYRVVPFYYNMTTGQILAFADRSDISTTTQENFRKRNIPLGEGRFFVDVEEFGAIVSVQLEDTTRTRNSARERVEGLVGLYVVLPPSTPASVEGVNEQGGWHLMPSQRTRLVPGENSNSFYRILGIANPEAPQYKHWSLLTLNPYANIDDTRKSIQVWIPREVVERFDVNQLVCMNQHSKS